jgi:hypothetical protein
MELAADFPPDMVLEMQRNAALKARRTIIERTLGGKVTFKALQDCLKLHLPAPFSVVTLLTRSYFEILFEDEEGAITTRKLAAVEWSGWTLSFSKYLASFRSNVQGAEALLARSVKVQFPDLHDQFRTSKALTITASNIGEVFEIESPDSYIKRPAGPMITVEVRDVSKLAGIIRIPSMVEGASPGDTTAQRILYSRLPNQCRKCRWFGHLAKACPPNRPPGQGGSIPPKNPPAWNEKTVSSRNVGAQRRNPSSNKKSRWQQGKETGLSVKGNLDNVEEAGRRILHHQELEHVANTNSSSKGGLTEEDAIAAPPPSIPHREDQEMAKHAASPPHLQSRARQGPSPP